MRRMTTGIEDMSRSNHETFYIHLIAAWVLCVFYFFLFPCAVTKAIMGMRVALVDLVRHTGALYVAAYMQQLV